MKYALPLLALIATPALADPPVIEAAVASPAGNAWRIDVTLRHPDTGWDHYATLIQAGTITPMAGRCWRPMEQDLACGCWCIRMLTSNPLPGL